MNVENDWDHNVEADAVAVLADYVSREEIVQAMNEIKAGKDPGPSEESLELIAASGEWEFKIRLRYVRVLDELRMPVEWALCIVVPIYEGKG